MSESIELEIEYSYFVNAFIVEGNHLLIFCNRFMLNCSLKEIHKLSQIELLIISEHFENEEKKFKTIEEEKVSENSYGEKTL